MPTYDHAMLHTQVKNESSEAPLSFEMKRLAPRERNMRFIIALGSDGSVQFSTSLIF